MAYQPLSDLTLTTTTADDGSVGAFGRQRVCNPSTIFNSKQLHDNLPLLYDEETSGGSETSSHSTADAATTMTVTANGEYVVRQSKMRMNYQPGKSQQILQTFVLGTATANITRRVGYYNSSTSAPYTANLDGIYLEQTGSGSAIVQSKNGTATSIAQASWNVDPFDGTGPSGVTLDWTKSQILMIDFEWLGVGRVRVGFVIDGMIYYAHEFLNANSVTSVYMSSPNHSLRWEIRASGSVTASMNHICGGVTSEGGAQALGILHYTSTDGTHVDATTENTAYAVVGIRLKSTHLDMTVRILNMAIQLHTASHFCEWQIILNPTVAGTFTYSGITNSGVEAASGATANTVTGGTILSGGYLESGSGKGGGGSDSSEIQNALRLGSAIDGTVDEVVLCAIPRGGASAVDVEGALFWRELV